MFAKTISYETDNNGRVTSSSVVQTVSAYCQYPSPGKLFWQDDGWARHPLGSTLDRRDSRASWGCDNFPTYTGPIGHPVRHRGRTSERDEEGQKNETEGETQPNAFGKDVVHVTWEYNSTAHFNPSNSSSSKRKSVSPGSSHIMDRAAESFLDASAFLYLNCGTNDDDPCYYEGDRCSGNDTGEGYTVPGDMPTPTTTSPTTAPTRAGHVYIDIFTDDGCINFLEQTQLNASGQCYSPNDSNGNTISFRCFIVTYISEAAANSAGLEAVKGAGCFSQDDSDRKYYLNLTEIQYDDENPFTMGSLTFFDNST